MSSPKFFMGYRGHSLKTAMLLLIVVPTFLLFGYNNGSTGGIATLSTFVKQFPQIDTVNPKGAQLAANARLKGLVTGVYDLGAVVGSLSCVFHGDKLGRKKSIMVGLIIALIALPIEASSYSLAQFTISRILIGMSIGIISATVPVWQAECSGSAHRGAFVMFDGLCIASGIALSQWVSFGFYSHVHSDLNWRIPVVLPIIFAIFAMPMLMFMPESPRWLARKGRWDEARVTLAILEDQEENSEFITDELAAISLAISEIRGSLRDLGKNGPERVLHRTLLACVGQMFQQMCGISALVFYTTSVFGDLGYKGTQGRILSACLSTFQACCSIIPLFTVDRFGRRKLFLFSAVGMTVCWAMVAGAGSKAKESTGMARTAVVFMFLYDFFFPIGFLGLTFLYATEVAPLKMRVPITAIANATQWMCQFIVAQVTPPGTTNLGNKYWIIYACIMAAAVPTVYFFFPETKARSLEDIDHIFEKGKYFTVVGVAKRMPRSEHFGLENVPTSDSSSTGSGGKVAVTEVEVVNKV